MDIQFKKFDAADTAPSTPPHVINVEESGGSMVAILGALQQQNQIIQSVMGEARQTMDR